MRTTLSASLTCLVMATFAGVAPRAVGQAPPSGSPGPAERVTVLILREGRRLEVPVELEASRN